MRDRAEKAEREAEKVKQEGQKLEKELQILRHQVMEKEVRLKGLESDLQKMTTRANSAEQQVLDLKNVRRAAPLAKAAPVPVQRPVPKVVAVYVVPTLNALLSY